MKTHPLATYTVTRGGIVGTVIIRQSPNYNGYLVTLIEGKRVRHVIVSEYEYKQRPQLKVA